MADLNSGVVTFEVVNCSGDGTYTIEQESNGAKCNIEFPPYNQTVWYRGYDILSGACNDASISGPIAMLNHERLVVYNVGAIRVNDGEEKQDICFRYTTGSSGIEIKADRTINYGPDPS